MVAIPTNARTAIRVKVPSGFDLQPWTIEFRPSEPDLVRLYSVDGDPALILVETHEAEGDLELTCLLGPHGTHDRQTATMPLEVRADATDPGELEFSVG